jgi:hypothetical protein
MSLLIIVEWQPATIIIVVTSLILMYCRYKEFGLMFALTDVAGRCERWWIRRKLPSAFSVNLKGEQIKGGVGRISTTRLKWKSSLS